MSSRYGLWYGHIFIPAGQHWKLYAIFVIALAMYKHISSNGLSAAEPFVGNNIQVVRLTDPDGYNIFFESPTDVPEETMYAEWLKTLSAKGK